LTDAKPTNYLIDDYDISEINAKRFIGRYELIVDQQDPLSYQSGGLVILHLCESPSKLGTHARYLFLSVIELILYLWLIYQPFHPIGNVTTQGFPVLPLFPSRRIHYDLYDNLAVTRTAHTLNSVTMDQFLQVVPHLSANYKRYRDLAEYENDSAWGALICTSGINQL
jgi:hypothetical protein